ncbi:MAG: hypothetical protein M3N91_09315 [Pseudomonadota bacterium]|nr:hypothetical protein [Pseudomonadota bacterium]
MLTAPKLTGLSGNEIYKTAALPAQAIICDKDTWLNGSGGLEIQSLRAGG